jgi:hypothetical protein
MEYWSASPLNTRFTEYLPRSLISRHGVVLEHFVHSITSKYRTTWMSSAVLLLFNLINDGRIYIRNLLNGNAQVERWVLSAEHWQVEATNDWGVVRTWTGQIHCRRGTANSRGNWSAMEMEWRLVKGICQRLPGIARGANRDCQRMHDGRGFSLILLRTYADGLLCLQMSDLMPGSFMLYALYVSELFVIEIVAVLPGRLSHLRPPRVCGLWSVVSSEVPLRESARIRSPSYRPRISWSLSWYGFHCWDMQYREWHLRLMEIEILLAAIQSKHLFKFPRIIG